MNSKILFIVLFLFHFIAVTPFASLCHNHEIDGEYHDDCLACRWEVQSLGDDPHTNTKFIVSAHMDQKVDQHCEISTILPKDQPLHNTDHSRAPPSIS